MKETQRYGRRYDAEYKREAVRLVNEGRSITDVARDLGVSHWSLSRWCARARQGESPSEPKSITGESQSERENRRLRQENDYLRRQRDILKKALGILSEGMPGNGMGQ